MSGTRGTGTRDGSLLAPVREEAHRLDPGTQAAMERAFGSSFGDVVLHAGPASGASADRFDAAAFTVGRHIVFGAGRYDPGSLRGRMLLAHELAHVTQQRRGGGDLELGEHRPAFSVPLLSGHSEGHAVSAEHAALAGGAPAPGATGAGVARLDKAEEQSSWARIKNQVRKKVRDEAIDAMTDVHAPVGYLAGAVDAVSWISYARMDLTDKAIDAVSALTGASESTRTAAKRIITPALVPEAVGLRMNRELATKYEFVDRSGNPSLAMLVDKAGESGEDWINKTLGTDPEEGYFTRYELGLIGKTLSIDVGLSFVAVGEVVLALKVVGGLGVGKAIYDAVMADPKGFYKTTAFWVAVVKAILYLVGLNAARVQQKLVAAIAEILSLGVDLLNIGKQLSEHLLLPDSPDRTKAVKADLRAMGQAVGAAILRFVTQNRTPKRPTGGESPAQKAPSAPPSEAAPHPTTAAHPPTENAPPSQPSATPTTSEPTTPAPTAVHETAPAAPPKPVATTVPDAEPVPAKQPPTAPQPAKVPDTEGVAPPKPAPKPAPEVAAPETQAAAPAKAPTEAAKAPAEPAEAPAAEPAKVSAAAGEGPEQAPKLTLSRARERAEAGERIRQRAQEKRNEAINGETKASTALTVAEQRQANAHAEIEAHKAKGKAPTKAHLNELRVATNKVNEAKQALVGAQAAKEASAEVLDTATKDAANRSKAYEEAKQQAAAKQAARDASKKPREKPVKPVTSKQDTEAILQKARELKKRAVEDKAAFDELEYLYKNAPDDVLKRIARSKRLGDDGLAAGQLDERQRARGREIAEKIRSGQLDPDRPPHEATVYITNDDGSLALIAVHDPTRKPGDPLVIGPARKALRSGGVDPKRKEEVPFYEANSEVHTEAKAVQMPLRKGQTMTIVGQYDPCGRCQSRMQAKAIASGATIVYWWPGNPKGMTFTPQGGVE